MNATPTRAEGYYPTGETAIVIVPPPDVCGFADHYRHMYMPDERRNIEPHITITSPFVPYDKLPEAEPRLREVLSGCPPRPVALRGFSVFPESGVLYLYLADHERVYSLYRPILAAFPEYPAYGGKYGDEFIPHMTVGLFSAQAEMEKVYGELANLHLFIAFDVEDVVVKYRTSDGIWDTWSVLPLGRWTAND